MSTVYLEHRDAHHVLGARSPAEVEASLQRAAEAINDCEALIFTAGAGMGVDSGLPDFRGSTGLFKDRELAMTYEEMSNDKWFGEDPAFAWGTNYTQLMMYRKTEPHAGYGILLKWANSLGKPYFAWTSNIDGMFEKAGFPAELVTTCHGDLHHLQCTVDRRRCKGLADDGADEVWSASIIPDGLDEQIDPNALRFKDAAILEQSFFKCPRCERLARPNVWFCSDRNYNASRFGIERRDKYNKWLQDLQERKARVVVIECGGGLAIPSVRIESEDAVEGCGEGSLLVRINPADNKVPAGRGVGIPLGSLAGLQRLDAVLEQIRSGSMLPAAASAPAAKAKASRRPSPGARRPSPGSRKPSPAPRKPSTAAS
eukprot:gb/GFBE01038081.1/.p1 GENE.gb/GFBE01038081.1/~~gb/GFBE01038081.1/.p1  ORF type:complete len:371 (+),score=71.07 gb/GFBE01038081.1/:1-1113(+)